MSRGPAAQAEQRFDERDGVAEPQNKAVRQWRLCHVLRRSARKGADAVADSDQSVAGEVDAEGDVEEGVGEGLLERVTTDEYGAGAEMVTGSGGSRSVDRRAPLRPSAEWNPLIAASDQWGTHAWLSKRE